MLFALILLALLGLAAAFAVGIYNRFVRLRAFCDEAFSGIDVQLKRRHDLVPQLVEVVKGASKFESGVLEKVTAQRAAALGAKSLGERESAEQGLSAAIGNFFAVAEAYPDLKATQGYQELQRQLAEIEDTLQNARRYYNACVRDNNTYGQTFPALLLAGVAGFKLRDFFMLEDKTQAAVPEIKF